jgi:hypothetical protein
MDKAKKAMVTAIQSMSCMIDLQAQFVAAQRVYRICELRVFFLRRKR